MTDIKMPFVIPQDYEPIKYGIEIIGAVSKKPRGIFGHYDGMDIIDGQLSHRCGCGRKYEAIRIVKDMWERKHLPQRPWHVRLKNGSRCCVLAANEEQALERAGAYIRRIQKERWEPVSAFVDDAPLPPPHEHVIDFGNLMSMQKV